MKRKLSLKTHDTSFNIGQDGPNDPTFRKSVFLTLIRRMRRRGWTIGQDPRYTGGGYWAASKGTLRASLECHGRSISLGFWSTSSLQSNPNGPKYDFDKLDRMPYLEKKRFELEGIKLIAWLETNSTFTVTQSGPMNRRTLTAMECIEAHYADSCHTDKELGRPVCKADYNRKCRDGSMLEHGQTVWFAGRDGRIRRGKAYYNINSMWWVVCNRNEYTNMSCFELYTEMPDNSRVKRNEKKRRLRLENELALAINSAKYERAEILHQIIFGSEPIYKIWSRKWDSFYGPNRSGYTSDSILAGKYTREEAEHEVKRVPHILSMVCPDGKHVRFTKEGKAA